VFAPKDNIAGLPDRGLLQRQDILMCLATRGRFDGNSSIDRGRSGYTLCTLQQNVSAACRRRRATDSCGDQRAPSDFGSLSGLGRQRANTPQGISYDSQTSAVPAPSKVTTRRGTSGVAGRGRRADKRDRNCHELWLRRARPLLGRVPKTIRRNSLADAISRIATHDARKERPCYSG